MGNQVNLNGTEYIQNIPGIYFDSTGALVKRLGNAQAGQYITKIGTTINKCGLFKNLTCKG